MKFRLIATAGILGIFVGGSVLSAVPLNTQDIRKMIDSISQDSVESHLKKFESFQTRNNLSSKRENFGIKAAAEWIYEEFRKANPKLDVNYDRYLLPKQGRRISQDMELVNVVGILPGTEAGPEERIFLINAHYDSIARGEDGRFHSDQPDLPAPGVNDDASGVTAMIEIARAFRDVDFKATVYFVAFAGEEIGLVGSTLLARKMKEQGKNIAGVLTLDMIGNIRGGSGRIDNQRMRVFSAGPADSSSRQLARFAKQTGEAYFPGVTVDLIYRADRFGRGGDHTPFVLEGFPGIRMMEANENYSVQHSPGDTFDNLSLPYCTRNIRLVAVVLASAACAPSSPSVVSERGRPMLGRGESGYDAQLRWNALKDADLSGYRVYWRKTTSPYWEKSLFAGKATEYVLPDLTIDEYVFGVSAVDTDGNESPVSAYVMAPRRKSTYETKK